MKVEVFPVGRTSFSRHVCYTGGPLRLLKLLYIMTWSYVALCSNFFDIHQRCSYVPGCQSVLVFYVFVWVSFN